jgi:hypothetical protein
MEAELDAFKELYSPIENSKIITIKKRKDFNDVRYSEFFSKEWNIRAYISYLEFSEPIIDFEGNEQKRLSLKTVWFLPESPYWNFWLEDKEGYSFGSSNPFAHLNEPFRSYSKQRLENWQKQAFDMHNRGLKKLEDLFYNNKKLEKDFLQSL